MTHKAKKFTIFTISTNPGVNNLLLQAGNGLASVPVQCQAKFLTTQLFTSNDEMRNPLVYMLLYAQTSIELSSKVITNPHKTTL